VLEMRLQIVGITSTWLIATAFAFLVGVAPLASAEATVTDFSDMKDPTRPWNFKRKTHGADFEKVEINAFNLTSILTAARRRIAVINGQRVGVNDIVDGAKVLKIESHQVVLDIDAKEEVIPLRSHRIKKTQIRRVKGG